MTVDRDTGIVESFVGSGTTGPFAVTNFNVATTDQIEPGGVTKVLNATGVATTLILNDPGANGYTAVIAGGLVTINTIAAVAAGWTLNVVRVTDKLQTVSLPIVGRFQPKDVEEALDLLAMQVQELSARDSAVALGSAEALAAVDTLSVGWAGASRLWDEIEVAVEADLVADSFPALRVSLDNGVTDIVLGYNWVSTYSFGTSGASTIGGHVAVAGLPRTYWKLSNGIAIFQEASTDSRLIGNFRISSLDLGKSSKIVGACTFTTVLNELVYVAMGGTLDAQISRINGITLIDTILTNNIALGSRIDVRGIR